MKRNFYVLLACLIFYSCSKKSSGTTAAFRADPLPDGTEMFILQPDESLPAKSEFVREIVLGQSLFSSDCGYKSLMNYARFTAKQSGANLIHLTEIKRPMLGNGCYHITARLYKNLEEENLTPLKKSRVEANKSRLPENADYAMVYFYRPKDFDGSIISYDVKMDDKGVIGKASNGARFEYKVISSGKHKFFGKTKKQDAITVDIEKGQEYFIRCGVTKGSGIAIPDMFLMENYVGKQELAEM